MIPLAGGTLLRTQIESLKVNVIDWFKQRQTPSAKSAAKFTRVAEAQAMRLDCGNDKRLADLLNSNEEPGESLFA